MSNAELEDCCSKDFYSEILLNEFRINIEVVEFKANKKWSDKIEVCFLSQGKPWSDTVEARVKFTVTESIPEDPSAASNNHKRSSIAALVTAVKALTK